MKILILYYSGVGNTKMVANKMVDTLKISHDITITSIENCFAQSTIADCDALIIGFPTIHASPAKPIMTFTKDLRALKEQKPVFIFTTCGLFSANALRIYAKECIEKGIIPIYYNSYRCIATDGVLIAPKMKIWFSPEKDLDRKIIFDLNKFMDLCTKRHYAMLPRFKLYSILNIPNKFIGSRTSPKIYLHNKHCTSCMKCVKNCPAKSIDVDNANLPFVNLSSCIHCYRCIHSCPYKALSLSKKNIPKRTLYNEKTYKE